MGLTAADVVLRVLAALNASSRELLLKASRRAASCCDGLHVHGLMPGVADALALCAGVLRVKLPASLSFNCMRAPLAGAADGGPRQWAIAWLPLAATLNVAA
ncbi:hypothetical protein Dimus_007747 [Dionaea muscipula]